MSGSNELLLLRLALIAVVFVFVLGVAFTMRTGLQTRPAAARAPRLAHGARFVVLVPGQTGLIAGDEFTVAGEMTIGRDAENGVILPDPSVSGHHATLARARDGWRLADIGSTNGTFVNGRAVDGRAMLLRGGEEVAFGAVVLRFQSGARSADV